MRPTPAEGDPAPWFHAVEIDGNPRFAFDTVAGRWIILLLLGTAEPQLSGEALEVVERNRDLLDDERACLFGVTVDPEDARRGRVRRDLPGVRWFLDHDRAVSISYGALPRDGSPRYAPGWLLIDPMMRIVRRAGLGEGAAVMAEFRSRVRAAFDPPAPVLVVPEVLSRDTCARLIDLYKRHGGADSGFMRDVDGVTVEVSDHSHKRRADHVIGDEDVIAELRSRIARSLRPMLLRAFQFDATRIERWIVGRYDGADGGHFRAHRDNTTRGTAHRRFACTINLNAEDYEGGDLTFPEFGRRAYRAPTGGAVVFSCSLLHEVAPLTRGRRYAFLPFLYDEEGARLRERNLPSPAAGGRSDPAGGAAGTAPPAARRAAS